VRIELTRRQVAEVVRGASGDRTLSVLLAGGADIESLLSARPGQLEDSRLSRSLLTGLLLLSLFPKDGSYIGNAQLAKAMGLNVSTCHRYLATLMAVGLVERDFSTRRYGLAI
jgi:IclR helix-turn-helix domain